MAGGWISTRASGMKKNLYGNIGKIGKLTHLIFMEEWREPLCNQDTRVILTCRSESLYSVYMQRWTFLRQNLNHARTLFVAVDALFSRLKRKAAFCTLLKFGRTTLAQLHERRAPKMLVLFWEQMRRFRAVLILVCFSCDTVAFPVLLRS